MKRRDEVLTYGSGPTTAKARRIWNLPNLRASCIWIRGAIGGQILMVDLIFEVAMGLLSGKRVALPAPSVSSFSWGAIRGTCLPKTEPSFLTQTLSIRR